MTSRLINPTKALGFSNLYLDFLAGQAPARQLFVSPGYQQTAQQVDDCTYHREQLTALLDRQNKSFGASEKTFEAIARLRNPQAVCYFAGQQAGLFGGPMLSLIKALGTIKAAEARSKELGRPVIPIFWIASDDHDFPEINNTFVLSRDGELCRIEYSPEPSAAVAVAEISLDDHAALAQVIDRLKECLGTSDFTPELYAAIEDAYSPGGNVVTAFGKLMAWLTREHGLVYFSPADPEAKRLAAPLLQAIVEQQGSLHELLNSANRKIEQARYHLQVEKDDQAVHLFYHESGRWPITKRGDQYQAGPKSFTHDELLAAIDHTPERFSPDVLTRPLMQSYLFPTLAQMGGPSEIAYFAQINPLFEQFGLPVPVHTARPTATVVEKRYEKMMAEYGITFEDLTGDIEQVVNRVLGATFPVDIDKELERLRQDLFNRFDQFSEKSLTFDPSLKESVKQTAGKIDFALKAYEGKVFASHKKKSKETRDRIYRLWNTLYPNRTMQDRKLNPAYFIAKYGFGVVSFLYDRLDPDQGAHQLISLTEYTS